MRKYLGREWRWWLEGNGHYCKFCHTQGKIWSHDTSIGGMVKDKFGLSQYDNGFKAKEYQVWLKHIKENHPEVLNNPIEPKERIEK